MLRMQEEPETSDRRPRKGDRLPCVRLSTRDLPPETVLATWQTLLDPYSVRLPNGSDLSEFRTDMVAWLLDPVVAITGRTSPFFIERVQGQTARSDANLAFVTYSEGRWKGDADGRMFDVGVGDLLALDNGRPSSGLTTGTQYIILNVPRLALERLVPTLPDLHGHVFRSASAMLLADHMLALARRLPEVAAEEAERIARASLTLIVAALGEIAPREGANSTTEPSAIRARVERHIERNLSSIDLTPKSICEELGIARTTLYNAFALLGGVANFISERRLETARAILFHPEDHRSIAAISDVVGFSSVETFSKAFKRQYGCSPREARATGTTQMRFGGRLLFNSWKEHLSEPARR